MLHIETPHIKLCGTIQENELPTRKPLSEVCIGRLQLARSWASAVTFASYLLLQITNLLTFGVIREFLKGKVQGTGRDEVYAIPSEVASRPISRYLIPQAHEALGFWGFGKTFALPIEEPGRNCAVARGLQPTEPGKGLISAGSELITASAALLPS